jgi:tetratricopeptide (TPR) repeat protein
VNRRPSRLIYFQIFLIGLLGAILANSPWPTNVKQAYKDVRMAVVSGAFTSAASNLRELAAYYPWRSDLLLDAAKLFLKAGDSQTAASLFEQFATKSDLPPEGLLALGDAYLHAGEAELAVQTWQQVAEVDGYSSTVLFRMLELHRRQEDYPLVIEDLKSLLRLHPQVASYYYQLGLLLAVFDPDASLAYLSQAAQYDTQIADNANALSARINTSRFYEEPAYTNLIVGRWLGSVSEWTLARQAFQQAVQLRPDYAEAWAYLGESQQHIASMPGQPDSLKGLNELHKALELDPTSIAALLLNSIYWQRQNDDGMAIKYLEDALELEPDNPLLHAEMGRVIAETGDLPSAQAHYERAAALSPSDPVYWRLLAEFALDKQIQVRELALPAARSAVLLAPHDPECLDLLAKTLISLGDLLNAERFLRRAVAADASYAPAHLHLGLIFLTQGQNELAQSEFTIAEQLAPDSTITEQVERLNSNVFP